MGFLDQQSDINISAEEQQANRMIKDYGFRLWKAAKLMYKVKEPNQGRAAMLKAAKKLQDEKFIEIVQNPLNDEEVVSLCHQLGDSWRQQSYSYFEWAQEKGDIVSNKTGKIMLVLGIVCVIITILTGIQVFKPLINDTMHELSTILDIVYLFTFIMNTFT